MIYLSWQDMELDAVADAILRGDRNNGARTSVKIDLVTGRDAVRRELRRHALVMRNLAVLELFACPISSPEELIIRKQEQRHASMVLKRILGKFERDKAAKAIILVVINGDISFSKTKEIARACQLRVDVVRAAKERLKYHVKTCENLLEAA